MVIMAKSSGRDKSLSEKLKSFLGFKEHTPLNFDHLKTEPYRISANLINDLFPENPVNNRLKPLKELCEIVTTKRLEDGAIETMYIKTKDMVKPSNPTETRQMVLQFYYYIILGQLEKMTLMRSEFFRLISNHKVTEDASIRLELLKVLSQNGKTITYFEEEIGPFLLSWFPEIINTEKSVEYLTLVVNIIKHNAAYLDDEIIAGFLRHTCAHCSKTDAEVDVQRCLEVMDAVLCYSHVPVNVLNHFLFTLCLKVNAEKFSQVCWKLMRNLLGTSSGHSAVYALCKFLQDKSRQNVPSVLRGAVFFIGMALWGSNKVDTLRHSPVTVLQSFLRALSYNSNIVAYEVTLSVWRLVKKNEDKLHLHSWRIVLDIIEALLKYPELQLQPVQSSPFAKCVHDLITAVEECNEPYCSNRLYKIIESCSDKRDDASVIRLINHHAQHINPIKEDFIPSIQHLLDKYFKKCKRQAVQLRILDLIRKIRVINGHFFQDDIIDQTILHYMSQVDTIPDVIVRRTAVELLLKMAETCINERYFDIISVIEKVMRRQLDVTTDKESQNMSSKNKIKYPDVEVAVCGLINLFERKLYMLPSSHCVKIYNLLISHIMSLYKRLSYSEGIVKVRWLIMDFLLKIRTNCKNQVGIFKDGHIDYSVYVSCSSGENLSASTGHSSGISPSLQSTFSFFPLTLSFEEMFQVFIIALKQEKDWTILELLFQKLPILLENKALVINGNFNISTLCCTLCALIGDDSFAFHLSLQNTPARFTRTECQSRVFPVMTSLAAYHSHMGSHIQSMLIRCLQTGLVSGSAKVCIHGLTLCTLEMQHMMMKHMPSVLLKLSQISATVSVSVAMLEFLSNLIRLPPLYVSFVEDQYRSIFAIALPYTNPYKFNQYTVALAHHVIAMWFLKCRIPFRKEFTTFILKGLRNNMSIPFDDRRSSLSARSENKDARNTNSTQESITALHSDLLEIGLDLMAKFTFGMSSNAPKRSVVAEFLLEKGQKSSWMIGNKIITITTSGCGTKAFKYGLCERCYLCCREICDSMGSDESESISAPIVEEPEEPPSHHSSERRRHKSAFHRRNTTLSEKLKSSFSTKDDMLLHREKSRQQKHFNRRSVPHVAAPTVLEAVPDSSKETKSLEEDPKSSVYQLCSCWCSGWAEIHVRRPTNTSSWIMRIQNQLFLPTSPPNLPLSAISSLLLPFKAEDTSSTQTGSAADSDTRSVNESSEEEASVVEVEGISSNATSEALMCPKTKVPLRRTNSSPDMNSGLLNYVASNRQKPSLQSSITPEEPFPPDLGSGDIFLFDEKFEEQRNRKRNLKEGVSFNLKNITRHPRSKTLANLELDLKGAKATGEKDINQFAESESSQSDNSFRSRGHTISVMSPNHSAAAGALPNSQQNKDMYRSGLSPSFVFLELFHNSSIGPPSHRPLLVRQTEQNMRSLSVIDHIHPYDTHKIGVIYVGEGQMDDERAILSNMSGSVRYVQFLRRLGNVVELSTVDLEQTYVGGLDLKGEDGKYALVWHDDVMRVVFHVATLMPNRKDDPKRNHKKSHVGNNFVTIVYNDSKGDYDINTIKSQFTRACIIIAPQDYNSNVVTSKMKNKELKETFGHDEAYIVSDESLPIFVRQMALHANLASLILDPRQQSAHVSNWLARLRAIKRLRAKLLEELKLKDDSPKNDSLSEFLMDDFTDYV